MIDLGIELRVKGTSDAKYTYAKLVAVKGMPATGQAGGNVETTTSSDPVKVYIPDRPDTGDMDFTYNYSQENLTAVQGVCDNTKKDILIKFPDGAGFEYQGVCQTWINETRACLQGVEGGRRGRGHFRRLCHRAGQPARRSGQCGRNFQRGRYRNYLHVCFPAGRSRNPDFQDFPGCRD